MHNNNYRRASQSAFQTKFQAAFESMREINQHKVKKLNQIDLKITRFLMYKVREEARRQRLVNDLPFIITAHELLGKTAFARIFNENRLPSLRQTIEIADRLDLVVEIRARRPSDNGCFYKLICDGTLSRKALVQFVEKLAVANAMRNVDQAVRNYRQEKLQMLQQNNTKVCWSSMVGFMAACGYDFEVWLIERDLIDVKNERLLSRLDYPV